MKGLRKTVKNQMAVGKKKIGWEMWLGKRMKGKKKSMCVDGERRQKEKKGPRRR